MELSIPEGCPCIIFSPIKAYLLIVSRSEVDQAARSSDTFSLDIVPESCGQSEKKRDENSYLGAEWAWRP